MSTDQGKGESNVIAGKLNENLGEFKNNPNERVKGDTPLAERNSQEGTDDVKEEFDEANEDE